MKMYKIEFKNPKTKRIGVIETVEFSRKKDATKWIEELYEYVPKEIELKVIKE